MKSISGGAEIGSPAKLKPGRWLQTDRKTHEIWAQFSVKNPTASGLLHLLCAHMGPQNAVVIPQKTLAQMMGVTDRTIRTAISALVAGRWVQVVKLGKGKEAAYVVNDRVAWGQAREQLRLSIFTAAVVANFEDQDEALLGNGDLRRIPTLYPGERQLPTGDGLPPPSQPSLDGLEPDLPATSHNDPAQ